MPEALHDVSVLLVEETPFVREQAATALRRLARTVHAPGDLAEAVALLRRPPSGVRPERPGDPPADAPPAPPDIAIVAALPALDDELGLGAALARRRPALPLLLACPADQPALLRRAAAADADGLLPIPCPPEVLARAVDNLAELALLRRAKAQEDRTLGRLLDLAPDPALIAEGGRVLCANPALLRAVGLLSFQGLAAVARGFDAFVAECGHTPYAGNGGAWLAALRDAPDALRVLRLAHPEHAELPGHAFQAVIEPLPGADRALVRFAKAEAAEDEAPAHCLAEGADPLTGACNRAGFMDLLEREQRQTDGRAAGFSLVMFDVDRFQDVIDGFGRKTGDRVLREVASRVRENMRDRDVLARWGGDVFLVLAPGSDLARATRIAERLRRKIEAHDFEGVPSVVTASFGVARHEAGESVEDLLRRVDAALRRARAGGRNRVVVADPETRRVS
ncbi:MAG: GGDEF domain-containing protein [Desulfovibrionaceae bacterium]|jgi:diguanylate cyclase (GGDEF)-like protein|nr:GGDEF domain-containing protein [Desulfovibrionaceae bacterium]